MPVFGSRYRDHDERREKQKSTIGQSLFRGRVPTLAGTETDMCCGGSLLGRLCVSCLSGSELLLPIISSSFTRFLVTDLRYMLVTEGRLAVYSFQKV